VGDETDGRADEGNSRFDNFTNAPIYFTLCPQSVFMYVFCVVYFVQVSEQTTIIFLYIIKSVAYIILTQCVFCALDH